MPTQDRPSGTHHVRGGTPTQREAVVTLPKAQTLHLPAKRGKQQPANGGGRIENESNKLIQFLELFKLKQLAQIVMVLENHINQNVISVEVMEKLK